MSIILNLRAPTLLFIKLFKSLLSFRFHSFLICGSTFYLKRIDFFLGLKISLKVKTENDFDLYLKPSH